MHTMVRGFIKYLLRSLFALIVGLLLIGVVKHGRNIREYVQFLDSRDWSESRDRGAIPYIFWGSGSDQQLANNNEQGTGDLNGDITSGVVSSGDQVDVYDPNFEQDLNIPQDTLNSGDYTDTGTSFGFVTGTGSFASGAQGTGDSSVSASGDSKAQLLELIKKRELRK